MFYSVSNVHSGWESMEIASHYPFIDFRYFTPCGLVLWHV
ncbi:Glucan endo-1,3-beta-glucosidase, acidic-like protein [Gossypium arboreum]|uniref:Glucan endo-1,3-beta-glucosidase, acidic-like protein n=1 Tax=Gossypium arboreum TaxID=29729 RepID=A0A0B0N0Z4_GOSAR|nr:Glucan endo-1,3-beta-glucosidase, acidic-like protein [Gossypium arboreum]